MSFTVAIALFCIVFWVLAFTGAWDGVRCRLFHRKHWKIVHAASDSGIYVEECTKCGLQIMTRR